jgi:biotin synthase-like enzyme
MSTRLDLHGVKHRDVAGKVIRLVERYWDTSEQLTIVTGHSKKMQKIVIDTLDEYGLEYYIGGILRVGNSFLTFYSGSSSD